MTASKCHECGADVTYVYGPGEEILTLDLGRTEGGNVVLEGGLNAHRVAPGSGTHRVHECETEEGV